VANFSAKSLDYIWEEGPEEGESSNSERVEGRKGKHREIKKEIEPLFRETLKKRRKKQLSILQKRGKGGGSHHKKETKTRLSTKTRKKGEIRCGVEDKFFGGRQCRGHQSVMAKVRDGQNQKKKKWRTSVWDIEKSLGYLNATPLSRRKEQERTRCEGI